LLANINKLSHLLIIVFPGSTVREGEFATAAQATGVPTRVLNTYNRVITGERLAPKQRKDFIGQSRNIFDRSKKDNDKKVRKFVNIGKQFGIAKSLLLGDEIQEAAIQEAQPAAPAAAAPGGAASNVINLDAQGNIIP